MTAKRNTDKQKRKNKGFDFWTYSELKTYIAGCHSRHDFGPEFEAATLAYNNKFR